MYTFENELLEILYITYHYVGKLCFYTLRLLEVLERGENTRPIRRLDLYEILIDVVSLSCLVKEKIESPYYNKYIILLSY